MSGAVEVIHYDVEATPAQPGPRDEQWAGYVLMWLAAHARNKATSSAYDTDARQWTDWCAGLGVHPLDARRVHVDLWQVHLQENGGFHGKPAAPKTIARKLSSIASLYTYLGREGYVDYSPVTNVIRPEVAETYAATISLDERQLRAVLAAARQAGPLMHAVVVTLALTGARAAEVLALDVSSVVEDHGHRCLNLRRKGGKFDRVVVPPSAAHVLLRHLGERTDGPLFLTAKGERLSYTALHRALARLGRQAGLPPSVALRPHMLRASFATISFDHGVSPDRIQDALGHADPRTTRMYDRGRGRLHRKAEPGLIVAKHVLDGREGD